jgi:hypothetical protein
MTTKAIDLAAQSEVLILGEEHGSLERMDITFALVIKPAEQH